MTMKRAQHAAHNSKFEKKWDYSDIPGGGHKTLKDIDLSKCFLYLLDYLNECW